MSRDNNISCDNKQKLVYKITCSNCQASETCETNRDEKGEFSIGASALDVLTNVRHSSRKTTRNRFPHPTTGLLTTLHCQRN